jgi:hypothetical protein
MKTRGRDYKILIEQVKAGLAHGGYVHREKPWICDTHLFKGQPYKLKNGLLVESKSQPGTEVVISCRYQAKGPSGAGYSAGSGEEKIPFEVIGLQWAINRNRIENLGLKKSTEPSSFFPARVGRRRRRIFIWKIA